MALCSSSSNPLSRFTKHAFDSGDLQRDRLVSKRSRDLEQGLRDGKYNGYSPIANDFDQFHDSHVILPLTFSGKRLIWGDLQDAEVVNWASEFQRLQSRLTTVPSLRDQHAHGVGYSGSNSHGSHRVHDQRSLTQYLLSGSHPTASQLSNGIQQGSRPPKVSSSVHCQQRYAEQVLESQDWEAAFKSIEPAMSGAHLEQLGAAYNQDACSQDAIDTTSNLPGMLLREHDESPPLEPTDYSFNDQNPFTQVQNPFNEGMEIVNCEGNLSIAALAFEAACQLDRTHLEAWKMLGSVLAENEREEAAIKALREAQKLDPQDLDVMMRLAVSYTNEGSETLAYENLERWLGTKYPAISIPRTGQESPFQQNTSLLQRIKGPYIQAAQISMATGKLDPNVQIGLGVLLFSEESYQMAADCFASAIQSANSDMNIAEFQLHLLWNRYGACLGNMGQFEAAIEAYEMALAIKPNFVRARCNLGLIHYNKNNPILGAKNTLQALRAYQAAESKTRKGVMRIVKVGTSHGKLEEMIHGGDPIAIYSALKKCCNAMCRWDLAEAVGPNMDITKFEKELDAL